jgi:hypothetical protein
MSEFQRVYLKCAIGIGAAMLLTLCLLTGCDSSVCAGGSAIEVVGSFTKEIK